MTFSNIALKFLDLSSWQPDFPNLFRFRCTLTGTHRWLPKNIPFFLSRGRLSLEYTLFHKKLEYPISLKSFLDFPIFLPKKFLRSFLFLVKIRNSTLVKFGCTIFAKTKFRENLFSRLIFSFFSR